MWEPVILDSARKHGIPDHDILHAYRHAIAVYEANDDMNMYVGADLSGNLLEVGTVQSTEGPVIIHAMKARPKYLR